MSGPRIEFVVTGDEVLRGLIADTNTAQTASKLYPLGVRLRRTVVVGDRGEDIRRALLEAAERAEFCIVSGGLGPTSDDLTAACAAQAAGVPLRLDEAWLVHLRARWQSFVRGPMPANNEQQAWVPEGAEILGNPDGSAPAFALDIAGCLFFFLPGVPREYHRIIDELVLPRIRAACGHGAFKMRTLQCFGVAESKLDELVAPVRLAHPEVRFGFRTRFPENHLSLAAAGADEQEAVSRLAVVEAKCRAVLGAFVYGADGASLARVVGEHLAARGETVACAESCTGGLLLEQLTSVPGSSRWVSGGFVTYSNALKTRLVGVPERLIAEHGAVSEAVVRQMAEGARAATGATYALAISGIAGPDGGTSEKPVGTVWLALAGPESSGGTHALHRLLRGDRGQIRLHAVFIALQMLREASGRAAAHP